MYKEEMMCHTYVTKNCDKLNHLHWNAVSTIYLYKIIKDVIFDYD